MAWDEFLQEIEDDDSEESENCIICFDQSATVTLMPCRHEFCNICVTRLVADENRRYPLCRSVIQVHLNQDHLKAFMLISIERDLLDSIDFKEILNIVKSPHH